MKYKKNIYAKLLFPVALAAVMLSLTACGSKNPTVGSEQTASTQIASSNNAMGSAASVSSKAFELQSDPNSEVPNSFFDDSVFIGDSVSLKLNLYVSAQRKSDSGFMGNAQFITSGSYGSGNELKELGSKDSVHPTYNGTEMYLADAVHAMRAKKLFIMLGMNDIAVYGTDGSVKNMETVLAKVKEKNPDTNIYVQSMTPIVGSAQKGDLTNANLDKYNAGLKTMCEQNGYAFIDVASVMKDNDGSLKREYCSDPDQMGVHFSDEGCKVWIDYIRTHVS